MLDCVLTVGLRGTLVSIIFVLFCLSIKPISVISFHENANRIVKVPKKNFAIWLSYGSKVAHMPICGRI